MSQLVNTKLTVGLVHANQFFPVSVIVTPQYTAKQLFDDIKKEMQNLQIHPFKSCEHWIGRFSLSKNEIKYVEQPLFNFRNFNDVQLELDENPMTLYFQNGESKFELTLRANCKIHELSEIISTNIKIPSKQIILKYQGKPLNIPANNFKTIYQAQVFNCGQIFISYMIPFQIQCFSNKFQFKNTEQEFQVNMTINDIINHAKQNYSQLGIKIGNLSLIINETTYDSAEQREFKLRKLNLGQKNIVKVYVTPITDI